MLKILVRKWDENQDKLRQELSTRRGLNSCEYKDLVKLTFEVIFNNITIESNHGYTSECQLDLEHIIEIDNGDYQGTLLYLIPFDCYQPSEYEYLMTYVGYGSCSGCDTLLSIQGYSDEQLLSASQVEDFMKLCKDILTNTIKPYNGGWRFNEEFEHTEE